MKKPNNLEKELLALGITYNRKERSFYVMINVNSKPLKLGPFDTAYDATQARVKAMQLESKV